MIWSCSGIAVGGGDCSPPQAERAIRAAKRASRNAAVCPHPAVLKKHGLIWNITMLWLKAIDWSPGNCNREPLLRKQLATTWIRCLNTRTTTT